MRIVGVLLAVLTLATAGVALQCYKCVDDPNCVFVQDPCPVADQQFMVESIQKNFFPDSKVDYSKPENIPKPVCYTSVTAAGTKKTSKRECSAAGAKLTCDVLRIFAKSRNEELDSCHTCDKDLCNTAPRVHIAICLLVFALLLRSF